MTLTVQPRNNRYFPMSNMAFAKAAGGLLGVLTKTRYFSNMQRTANPEIMLLAAALSDMIQAMEDLVSDSQSSMQVFPIQSSIGFNTHQ